MNKTIYLLNLSFAIPLLSMQPNAPISMQRLKQLEAAQVLATLAYCPVVFRATLLWHPLAPKGGHVKSKINKVPRTGGSISKKEYPGQITLYDVFQPKE